MYLSERQGDDHVGDAEPGGPAPPEFPPTFADFVAARRRALVPSDESASGDAERAQDRR